jgi:hypothetical protein
MLKGCDVHAQELTEQQKKDALLKAFPSTFRDLRDRRLTPPPLDCKKIHGIRKDDRCKNEAK